MWKGDKYDGKVQNALWGKADVTEPLAGESEYRQTDQILIGAILNVLNSIMLNKKYARWCKM